MRPWETFRVAVYALLGNKLRSFLTILGVVIGVALVIAMMAIGEGAKARVNESFVAMGTNLLIILPGTTTAGGAPTGPPANTTAGGGANSAHSGVMSASGNSPGRSSGGRLTTPGVCP